MKKLTILSGLVMALALALPGGASAASFSEVKKLTASDAQAGDQFGFAVAMSGDTAIVGAYLEDAGGSTAGAAYIFERDQGGPNNWGEVKKLFASDAQAGDWFGVSVAIDGDIAIVGARQEDAGGSFAGAAYVFERDQGGPGNWGEVTKLTASDAQTNDVFGVSVAVSGDTIIVGAGPRGAAYIFERDQGGPNNWGEVKKLTASDAQAFDGFGHSVAVSGDTAVVGARGEDAAGSDAGAAYVFERDAGGADNWGEVTKLTASDAEAGDHFGENVAVSSNTAVVGAWAEDAGGGSAGAAYVFERDQGGPNNWGEVTKLTASDAEASDAFGFSVAVNGDVAVVGARGEDEAGSNAGAAYVFQRDQGGPNNWGEVKKLAASDIEAADLFGYSVAVSGDTVVASAVQEATGGSNAGAAYVFQQPQPVGGLVVDLGEGPQPAAQPSGGSAGRLAGTVAGIAALSVTLTGAAWYARRRL